MLIFKIKSDLYSISRIRKLFTKKTPPIESKNIISNKSTRRLSRRRNALSPLDALVCLAAEDSYNKGHRSYDKPITPPSAILVEAERQRHILDCIMAGLPKNKK